MTAVPAISVQFQWINDHDMQVDTFSYLKGVVFIPWAVKPLFALIPKNAAMIGACVGQLLTCVLLLAPMSLYELVVMLLLFQVFVVMIDVHIDGWMLTELTAVDRGELQSRTMIFKTLGSTCGSLSGALIYHYVHDRIAFAVSSICACFILILYLLPTDQTTLNVNDMTEIELGGSIMSTEPSPIENAKPAKPAKPSPIENAKPAKPSPIENAKPQGSAPNHKYFAVFVFLLFLQPSVASAVLYYTQKILGVTDVEFGILSVVSGFAAVMAQLLYSLVLRRCPLTLSVSVGISGATVLSLSFIVCLRLGVPVIPLLIMQSFIGCILDVMVNMPVTVRAAKITKEYSRPVVMYALVTSVMNLCGITSMEVGAFITHVVSPDHLNLDRLTTLLYIEELFAFIPLLALLSEAAVSRYKMRAAAATDVAGEDAADSTEAEWT